MAETTIPTRQGNQTLEGRIIQNQISGRIEIYDEEGHTSMWIGNCGTNAIGEAITGTMAFRSDGTKQTFTGIYGSASDGEPMSGTVSFDSSGLPQVFTGVYGQLAAGMLVFDSSGIPIYHSGYQAGGY